MIQESGKRVVPLAVEGPRELGALRRLPQPLHIFEFVGCNQHYHFGRFAGPEDSLPHTQDRMSLWGASHFAAGAAVLDIGCGLGGTSRLLAARGLRVTGIDPCLEAVDYARDLGVGLNGSGPRLLHSSLEEFARGARGAHDGALALEVLQHFPALAVFFGCCRKLLRPGGVLVVHDVATHVEVEWSRVPYHRHGRVRAAAEAAGFRRVEHQDLTREILPTLPRLTAALDAGRAEMVAAFADRRGVERELDELIFNMGELQRAFEQGHLAYEASVLLLDRGERE